VCRKWPYVIPYAHTRLALLVLCVCGYLCCLLLQQACGEPEAQFGIIEQGNCGYTNSDGSLPFPREMYAALADTNEDFPGSCGRCYQVRAPAGAPCACAVTRAALLSLLQKSGMPHAEGNAVVA
jgi:hypothetical protein